MIVVNISKTDIDPIEREMLIFKHNGNLFESIMALAFFICLVYRARTKKKVEKGLMA